MAGKDPNERREQAEQLSRRVREALYDAGLEPADDEQREALGAVLQTIGANMLREAELFASSKKSG